MSEFNRMTIVAAAKVIAGYKSHDDMAVLEVEWGIVGRCATTSKSARVAGLARIATEEEIEVVTMEGRTTLSRALVEVAMRAPEHVKAFPLTIES